MSTQTALTLKTLLTNGQNDILAGRSPVPSWDGIVQQWRAGGGDTMRNDYETQLQKKG